MNDELKNLSDEDLNKRIEDFRIYSDIPGNIYHRYIEERERRREQTKHDIEQKRFEDIKSLLDSISNKPVRSVIVASLVAVAIGVTINLLRQGSKKPKRM